MSGISWVALLADLSEGGVGAALVLAGTFEFNGLR